MAKLKYHILLHFIVLIWGLTGILGKLIHQEALVLVWYRLLIAVIALFLFFKLKKHSLTLPSTKTMFTLFGIGCIVMAHWVTFYYSIQLSTASLGILCLSTTTIHVTWLEPLLFGKKFSWFEFLLSITVVIGIYLVANDFSGQEYLALFIGLCSAFLAALFSVLNAKVAEQVDAFRLTFYELLGGFVLLGLLLGASGQFNEKLLQVSTSDVLWLLFLGIICTSFAFLANIEVLKRLGAFTVSLTINLEPVYTIILAIFMLGEDKLLSGNFYIGAGLIFVIVICNALVKQRLRKSDNKLN